ncbi:platelet endothelial aggregation receptor 1-like [Mobula hypostoma]|uniref:platelet endothelial aggregation receptor 1-like n=1 Tax=Mobula hypostoma TaxID=723540 RepID=UPI002FC3B048
MGGDNAGELCDPGFYCKKGAKSATPLDGVTGDICPVGHYCPSGSAVPTPCENGKFVNHTGAEECFTCPEGYQCTSREEAEPCPQGAYCPKGTGVSPQPCPVGTFGASQGLTKISDCTPCLGGSYCSSLGLTQTEGPCDPGFYCVSGVNSPHPSMHVNHTGNGGECSAGAYCPRNSTLPIPCPPGTYNSETGQSICQKCLAGYFCLGGLSNPYPLQCLSGYYCPECTRFANEFPCPSGTYGSLPGLQSSAGCLPCPPGQFCEGNGLSSPSGNCSEGWFCTGGASTSRPLCSGDFLNSSNCGNPESVSPGNRCPLGSFCPEGSSLPLICTAGYYCDQYELADPTGPCDAGYYCPIGSTDRAPDQFKCIAGHYCPEGSALPVPCPEATYSTTAGNKALDNCLPCTQGVDCPVGYYSNKTGLTSPDDCTICDPGFYCNRPGMTSPQGPCAAGHYCKLGAQTPNPNNGTEGLLCPAGYYCTTGTTRPAPCPIGTYNPSKVESEKWFCDWPLVDLCEDIYK